MGMSDVKDFKQISLKDENEFLQQQVSQMKVDIEALVGKGWQSGQAQGAEWESKCKVLEEKIKRLIKERDQLVTISTELRAELNRYQRLYNDIVKQEANKLPQYPV